MLSSLNQEVKLLASSSNVTQEISDADNDWNQKVSKVINQLATRHFDKFLTWDTIRNTMFIEFEFYIKKEYETLKRAQLKNYLKESSVGSPTRYLFSPSTSANSIHHLYHLYSFQKLTGVEIKELSLILEFGGGYGNIAKLAHRLGFNGTYCIYDFPVFNIIQKTYLKNQSWNEVNFSDEIRLSFINSESIDEWNFNKFSNKLFLATWSISETSISLRNEFLSSVQDFDYFFIAFQEFFHEVDNLNFFKNWSESLEQVSWDYIELKHIGKHFYLLGKKDK